VNSSWISSDSSSRLTSGSPSAAAQVAGAAALILSLYPNFKPIDVYNMLAS
jgi:hypothetical protein